MIRLSKSSFRSEKQSTSHLQVSKFVVQAGEHCKSRAEGFPCRIWLQGSRILKYQRTHRKILSGKCGSMGNSGGIPHGGLSFILGFNGKILNGWCRDGPAMGELVILSRSTGLPTISQRKYILNETIFDHLEDDIYDISLNYDPEIHRSPSWNVSIAIFCDELRPSGLPQLPTSSSMASCSLNQFASGNGIVGVPKFEHHL